MTNCNDPCDDCHAKFGNNCNAHEQKNNLKCKIICDKQKSNNEHSCQSDKGLNCRISCSKPGKEKSKETYEVLGNLTLFPLNR